MAWYEKYLTTPAPTGAPAIPSSVQGALAGDPQAARYAQGALRRACDEIAHAPEGTRNHTLNAQSWSIGQLVKAGHLAEGEAQEALWLAGKECGLPDGEIARTIPRAIAQAEAREVHLDPDKAPSSPPGGENIAFSPQPPAGEENPGDGTLGEENAASLGGQQDSPPPTPEEAGRLRFQHDVDIETRRLAVHEEAKRRLEADRAADILTKIRPPTPLPDFLAVKDPPIQWVLEGLQPVGTRALLAAQAKSGKTTLVANLLKALADRQPFLGDFLNHFTGTITLVDDELDERMLRRWLDRLGIERPEHIQVVSLRGRLGMFNIVEPTIRARWAEVLAGTDYLILDCLRPVLDACGLDESREAGVFLNAFDELMVESGADSALVVHHMGHSTARSRGDSRIMDWPDALWRLVRENPEEPSSARQFSAFGREVDVPPQTVHYREGVVTLTGQPAPVVKRSTEPLGWVIETWMNEARGEGKPGKWWEDHARIDQDAGLYAPSRDGVRESIQYLVQEGSLVQSREGRRVLLSLNSDHERVIEVVAGG